MMYSKSVIRVDAAVRQKSLLSHSFTVLKSRISITNYEQTMFFCALKLRLQ